MKELGNFIRDFTLIDFMGILFPGSILLLLLQMDYSLWDKLDRAWGAAPESGVRVAFILIGGYFVGTLLMELGDFWEQFIWKNLLLNPRSWAAISTGLYNQVSQTVSKPKWQTTVNLISGCLLTAVVFFILFFSGVFGLLMRHIPSWISIAISLVVFSEGIADIYVRKAQKFDESKWIYIIGCLLGLGVFSVLLARCWIIDAKHAIMVLYHIISCRFLRGY